jgi:hypothetical protein
MHNTKITKIIQKCGWLPLVSMALGSLETFSPNGQAVPVTNILTQPNTELVQTQNNSVTAASVTATMSSAQTAGNTNVVFVFINSTSATVSSISDTSGNTYNLAVGPTTSGNFRLYGYYATKIKTAAAGSNTITVNVSASVKVGLGVSEYSGIDGSNPVDTTASATGSSASASTSLTTTNANDVLVTGMITADFFLSCSSSDAFTIYAYGTAPNFVTAHRMIATSGSNSVTCSSNASGDWNMQTIAFRAVKPPPIPPIAYVQGNTGVGSSTTTNVTYSAAQTAGNLNVVIIGAASKTVSVSSVTDSKGNSYSLAIGPTTSANYRQWIYYAPNIASAAAGTNTVTITTSSSTTLPIRIAEYSGLSTTSPLDQTAGGVGTATCGAAYTSSVTTNYNQELIVVGMTNTWAASAILPLATQRLVGGRNDILGDYITYKRVTYQTGAVTANCSEFVGQLATFH